jgi:pyruvate/2-oxoglutarate dehydrogenase complex dihydrolipoamide dehydrogenase (E3) component
MDREKVFEYRDYMIRNLDDSGQVEGYERKGATVVKGEGRISGPGEVEVDGGTLRAEHIVVATGSSGNVPPIEGIEGVTVWTNREATTTREVPGRAVIVGGGPNGVETAQWLSRLGTEVTLVQSPERLVNREEPGVSELIQSYLKEEGIEVHTGRKVAKVRKEGGASVAELDDGTGIETDVLVISAGRTPRVKDIGLETVGVEPGGKGLPVDERCRLAEGVWAVGDATGVALFTHVAKYQARVVAENILGRDRRADYRGVPRVVFSDPEIAAAGLTGEQARRQGIETATAELDLTKALARPWTYEENPRGYLGLVVDRERRVLVGAWAVAPQAGEWIHEAALAIKAEIPIEVLLDTVAQFPTFSEGYQECLERLEL